jgi:excisionase family DNA binding protein
MTTQPPAALRVGEVARLLGVHRSSVYRAVHRGELRIARLGKRFLIPAGELERLLGERLRPGSR